MKVGAFELRSIIGRGAMAEVHRAVHQSQGVPVAVKVLDAEKAAAPRFQRMLYNEARAMAGLHHPGIAMVYDIGRTTSGSPWIALEMASGGSLEDLVEVGLPWPDLKELLLALLDALAHAHARGVLHRDLKPANILLCTEGDLRPGLKISDFGLAMPIDTGTGSSRISGTPAFMAPEQARGLWRDFGPWTDLYGVGCLAWQLCCGEMPLHGDTLEDWLRAQVEQAPAPLRPRTSVPAGLEMWLLRLLEKAPSRRYRSAADAAWGLIQLGDAPDHRPTPWESEGLRLAPSVNLTVIGLLEQFTEPDSANRTAPLPQPESPPLVRDWRRTEPRTPLRMLGAGLGLYAFRSVPLVGRTDERDQIWAQLFEAVDTTSARAVVVDGGAGVGKSRLVRWVCRRAEELGAATVLRSMENPIPGPEDGVSGMLSRSFRCQGLGHDDVAARVSRGLRSLGIRRDDAAHAITELIAGRELLFSRSERWEVVAELLEAMSWRRPVVLWVDDAQWAEDGLELCRHILARQARKPSPMLLIVSGRSAGALEGTRISLGPLPSQDHTALVAELLGLEDALVEQVADRTQGNPLFATQLVGDWVQRGLLVPGKQGFRLSEGPTGLPDSLHQLARDQVDRLVKDPIPLELAACLGREARVEELNVLIPVDEDDLRALEVAGLLTRTREEVSFRNEVLRESLLRTADEEGRLASHHARCAEMLEAMYPDRPRGAWERLAAHRHAAGQYRLACQAFRAATTEARSDGELGRADRLLKRWRTAAEDGGLPPNDPEWGLGLVARANCDRALNQDDDAIAAATEAVTLARAFGWAEVEARGLTLLGLVRARRGEAERARPVLLRAREMCADQGLLRDQCAASMGLAWLHMRAKNLDEAEGAFREVIAVGVGGTGTADALNGMAECARLRGRNEHARALYTRAIAEPHGSPYTRSMVRLNLGMCHLRAGEYPAAGACIEQAHGEFMRQGRVLFQAWASALLLPGLANSGFWQAFDERLRESTTKLSSAASASSEVAWALAEAARLCRESAQHRRAWSCGVLAVAQYRSAGQNEEAEAVRAQMKG